MLRHLIAAVLLLLPLISAQTLQGRYFITAPADFRPGSPYTVHVTVLDGSTSLDVTALIWSHGYSWDENKEPDETIVTKTVSLSGSGSITLDVPDTVIDERRYFKLNVSSTGDIEFDNSTSISKLHKTTSIFVQTDKAQYKPGDTVNFRLFATGPDLRAITDEPFQIKIYDADGNKIKQWLDQDVASGLFTGALPISSHPILGEWKILVNVKNEEYEKKFKIAKYVLPKYKVDVELPPFLERQMELMPITIKSNYTFGKPVEGKVLLIVRQRPGPDCYDPANKDDDYSSYMVRKPCKSKIFTQELKEGRFDTEMSKRTLKGLLQKGCYKNSRHCDKPNYEYSIFDITANVTEYATGTTLSGNAEIEVKYDSLNLKFMEATPSSYKPDMGFKAWIKVERPDGTPPAPADYRGELEVTISTNCPYRWNPDGEEEEDDCEAENYGPYRINLGDYPDGIVPYHLPITIKPEFNSFSLQAKILDKYGEEIIGSGQTITKFNTETKANIQILMDSLPTISADTTATFMVNSSEAISMFYYQLLAKGSIVRQGVVNNPSPSNRHELVLAFDADFAQQLSPTAKLIVVYFTETADGHKEAIADSVSFNVDQTFAYETSVSFSKSEVRPADQLMVEGSTAPDSTVALLAVDQSVLLLESGNDITSTMVDEEINNYDPHSHYYPWMYGRGWWKRRKRRSAFWGGCYPIFIGGNNIQDMMNQAGMIFMCDCVQAGSSPDDDYVIYDDDDLMFRGAAGPNFGVEESAGRDAGASSPGATPRVRQEFPETWIWSSLTPGDGTFEIPVVAPDTITSWVLSAFSINSDKGLSVAETAKTTVFQPFFARVSLPYAIVRGEQFALKVTVFNYLAGDQDVLIKIDRSDDFKVITPTGDKDFVAIERNKLVKSQGTATINVWIIPQTVGHIPIKVTATSPQAGDSLIRKILVKPEGIPQVYVESEFLQVSGSQEMVKFIPDIPEDAVPGSQHILVTVVGDIMGSAMDNLDGLIRMPYGCGEQNMVNFAPNIYVMKYLQVTGQDKEDIKDKAIRYMETGYQRELTYMRTDGSYSAFGNSDSEGSTWLTAFVVKCFSQANEFIKIDEDILRKNVGYLRNLQTRDGQFRKEGFVHHSGLKGGAAKGVTLTPYTTIALIEANKILDDSNVRTAIEKAVTYLEDEIDSNRDDWYALALITYALTLAESSQASYALNQLNALATVRGGQTFWADEDGQSFSDLAPWERYYRTPPLDVETAAYGLMSLILNDGDTVSVVRFLTSRMNPQGGFYSTQDTVMGLEALGMFAENLYADSGSQNVNLEVLAMNKAHNFQTITTANAAVVQSYEAPADSSEVTITGTGSGAAVVQMTVSYNTKEPGPSNEIVLQVGSDADENTVTVSVCMQYNGAEPSGMSLLEVNSLSGYFPTGDKELLEKYKDKGLKTVEVEGSKAVLYFEEIDGTEKCVQVEQQRVDSVMGLQAQEVKLYKYYNPKVNNRQTYLPLTLEVVDECRVCPDCEGCEYSSASSAGLATLLFSLALLAALLIK